MAVKVSHLQLPRLLSWLHDVLPHSFKLHGDLKTHLKGQFPDLDFFVDRWPHPRAVIARVDPSGKQMRCMGYWKEVIPAVYADDEEAMGRLLEDPNIVDWNTVTIFPAIPASLEPVMRSVAEQMGRSARFDNALLLKATSRDLKPVSLPKGMKIRPVSSADCGLINSTWPDALKESEAYLQELVQRFPSVYMATEDGRHVGHSAGYNCNTVGFMHVNPEFRRKGYARFIETQLAQKYVEGGEAVHGFVDEGNTPARKVHEIVGYRVVPNATPMWMILH